MERLRNYLIGIDRGDPVIFSDFEDGGEMWTGSGPRERRNTIKFSEKYRSPPVVHASISLWDIDAASVIRADVTAQNVTNEHFDLVFNTWGNTRVARVRISWMAIGELTDPDDWDIV